MKKVYSLMAQKTITNIKRVVVDGVEKLKVTYRDNKVRFKNLKKTKKIKEMKCECKCHPRFESCVVCIGKHYTKTELENIDI